MHAANLFGVMSVIGFIFLLPVALFVEGGHVREKFEAMDAMTVPQFGYTLFISWCFGYFSGEVAYIALDNVHPVTHAVGNTLKRVFIICSAIIIFKTRMSFFGYIGSFIAVIGKLVCLRAFGPSMDSALLCMQRHAEALNPSFSFFLPT